jgi:hypothetical protein
MDVSQFKYGIFDIESENWIDFRALGLFDGQRFKVFRTAGEFLTFIDRKEYEGFRWYAHNGGKFDVLFLLDSIFRRKWEVKFIQRQGRIIALHVTTGKCRFTIADSYALLPASLKALGEAFQTEHKKRDFDVTRGFDITDPEAVKYLEHDCLCLYEVLTSFLSNDFIHSAQYTIASQAMNTFRQDFFPSEMYRMNLIEEDIFRNEFYSGGRVEVFKGEGDVNAYDVNSLYPYAMLYPMPCGMMKRTREYKKGKIGFYLIEYRSTPDFYVSPLLIKRGGKNFYVQGPGQYFLSSATIEFLRVEFGMRGKVIYGYVFDSREMIFQGYVETFYAMKLADKKNKGPKYTIAKLFLNSLYGKFGQMRWKDTVVSLNSVGKQEYTTLDGLTEFGLVLVSSLSRSKFICPYIAAYVTELARLHHFKLMNQKPGAMFYCDTDSLYTSASYPTSDKIGGLSFEGRYRGIFLAPKNYALLPIDRNGKRNRKGKEKIVFKGFDTAGFTYRDFVNVANGEGQLREKRTRILSFQECVTPVQRSKGIIHRVGKFLRVAETEKVASGMYDRREKVDSKKFRFETRTLTYFK